MQKNLLEAQIIWPQKELSFEVKELIAHLVKVDPNERFEKKGNEDLIQLEFRLTMEQVCEHSWFRGIAGTCDSSSAYSDSLKNSDWSPHP